MLQANLVTTYLQMLGSGGTPQRADLPRAAQAFPLFSPGQALSALIVTQLGPGLYLADVDGQLLQLNMPMPASRGEQISLRLLRNGPVPVFDLVHADQFPPKTQTSLSGAAQLISSVLAGGPSGVPAAAPLVPEDSGAGELAIALRQAVAKSGLFYESHLVEWAAGKRTLAEIRDEPHALWSAKGAIKAGPDDARRLLQEAAIPDEAKPLVRQQLDALEMNRITWSGQLWPGQNAVLTIEEEVPNGGTSPVGTAWRTSISLQLPRLGEVQADLGLRQGKLSVSIDCGDAQGAARISSDIARLRSRIEAAGLALADIRVSHHDAH